MSNNVSLIDGHIEKEIKCVKDAINILLDETPTDYIQESYETPEFFEFHVSCGGDSCVYRIYKANGKIYEK